MLRSGTYENLTPHFTSDEPREQGQQCTRSQKNLVDLLEQRVDVDMDKPIDFAKRYMINDLYTSAEKKKRFTKSKTFNKVQHLSHQSSVQTIRHSTRENSNSVELESHSRLRIARYRNCSPDTCLDLRTPQIGIREDDECRATTSEKVDKAADSVELLRLQKQLETMHYCVEIAEAQALVFHLSEQVHKEKLHQLAGVTERRDETEAANRVPFWHTELNSETKRNESRMEQTPESGWSKLLTAPKNLQARPLLVDNRWLITWEGPAVNQFGESDGLIILGYKITLNGQECKYIQSPAVTRCILQLPLDESIHRGPIDIGVQTMGPNTHDNLSPMATLRVESDLS